MTLAQMSNNNVLHTVVLDCPKAEPVLIGVYRDWHDANRVADQQELVYPDCIIRGDAHAVGFDISLIQHSVPLWVVISAQKADYDGRISMRSKVEGIFDRHAPSIVLEDKLKEEYKHLDVGDYDVSVWKDVLTL